MPSDQGTYIWDVDHNEWKNLGNFIGEQGAQGPKGDTGATGAAGDDGTFIWRTSTAPSQDPQVPGYTFTISSLTGPAGKTPKVSDYVLYNSTLYYIESKTTTTVFSNSFNSIKGNTGATGPKGDTGAQGPTGATGATGAKGDPGPAGATGATGPAGETGPQGPAGANGAKGDRGSLYWSSNGVTVQGTVIRASVNTLANPFTGETPAPGDIVIGMEGRDDTWGFVITTVNPMSGSTTDFDCVGVYADAWTMNGAQGPQGPRGNTGPKGATGAKGDTGSMVRFSRNVITNNSIQDSQNQWHVGDIVITTNGSGDTVKKMGTITAKSGLTCTLSNVVSIEGPKGDTGATGPAGAQGPQGARGPKGDTGPQGIQGIQGPKGVQGATGAQGPQGAQGPKGDKGDTGIGIITGGSTNQVLAKSSNSNYALKWMNVDEDKVVVRDHTYTSSPSMTNGKFSIQDTVSGTVSSVEVFIKWSGPVSGYDYIVANKWYSFTHLGGISMGNYPGFCANYSWSESGNTKTVTLDGGYVANMFMVSGTAFVGYCYTVSGGTQTKVAYIPIPQNGNVQIRIVYHVKN